MVDKKIVIEKWKLLDKYFNYSGAIRVKPSGSIIYAGWLILRPSSGLPTDIKILEVKGDFNCSNNLNLESLKGAPRRVSKSFICNNNPNLQSLEGAPKIVGHHFSCIGNPQLRALNGAPVTVGKHFYCYGNALLQSLEGSPQTVDGDFWCQHNQLLQSLYGLPTEIGGRLHMSYSKTLPLLRALVAKGGVSFESDQHKADADKVAEIINLYKGQGKRAMFNCQKDLEDAGFEGNAKW